MSVKFRFSCGMALLVCTRSYRRVSGAAQESIREIAEAKQVLQRADELKVLWRVCVGFEIGPFRRDQRLTAVRQNENELQTAAHVRVPQNLQRLPLKGVMRTRDGHLLREVLTVGSVWWFPSIRFPTRN
jgi:hypothetical protein